MSSARVDGARIAIVVDNPFRDLPAMILVAWRLCQAGATCFLVPYNLFRQEIWPLAPDFVLFNFLRPANEEFVSQVMAAGIRTGVFDTEGGVFGVLANDAMGGEGREEARDQELPEILREYTLTLAKDPEIRYGLGCYCAWTPFIAQNAVRAGWYRQEQVVATGSPRADFAHPNWQEVLRKTSPYVDEVGRPLILINSTFPSCNPKFQTRQQEAEMLVRVYSYDPEYVRLWQESEIVGLRGLAAATNAVAHRFPEATVVYRPHPFEDEELYRFLLDPLPNLHVIKRGTVDNWLLRASAVVHLGSSTALEAGTFGLPALSPGWLPVYREIPAVEAVTQACASQDELNARLAEALSGGTGVSAEVERRRAETLEGIFYRLDGSAHQRIADTVVSVLQRQPPKPDLAQCRQRAYAMGQPNVGKKDRQRFALMNTFKLPLHWSFRYWANVAVPDVSWWDRSDKQFTPDDVRKFATVIQECARRDAPADVRPVRVESTGERGDYHFGYRVGRAVTLAPA